MLQSAQLLLHWYLLFDNNLLSPTLADNSLMNCEIFIGARTVKCKVRQVSAGLTATRMRLRRPYNHLHSTTPTLYIYNIIMVMYLDFRFLLLNSFSGTQRIIFQMYFPKRMWFFFTRLRINVVVPKKYAYSY